ncbi:hypothetical protein Tco_0766080 [Tanacetum coccineum]
MHDRTNYESWSQRILLTRELPPEGGVLLLTQKGLVHDADLSDTETKQILFRSPATKIVLQGLDPKILQAIKHNIGSKSNLGPTAKCYASAGSEPQTKIENLSCTMSLRCSRCFPPRCKISMSTMFRFHKQSNDNMRNIRMTMPNIQLNSKFVNNMSPEWDRFVTAVKLNKGMKEINHEQLYAYLKQHEKHAAQDRLIIERITPAMNDQLAFNVQGRQNQNQRYFARGNGTTGNRGAQNRAGKWPIAVQGKPADECDAFDSDVDDEPTAQSIFMANLSSVGSANPQVGLSNASILSEVHILENAIDNSVTNLDEHEIHNEVQQANVIDSTSVDMGNSNVIPYEQYLSVDNISVVPSCASSALNDVCVSSDNYAFVPHDPIATELKIYKEQVAIYEQRDKFELTKREQRIDDQMRMLIQNRNKTEENLKKELHSVKLQLNSTMENNKIIEETVTILKHEFKQKESKFLTDFSNLKQP